MRITPIQKYSQAIFACFTLSPSWSSYLNLILKSAVRESLDDRGPEVVQP